MFDNDGPRASRCSDCSINYPASVRKCHVCGDPTWYLYQSDPDEDWREVVARALQIDQTTPESPYPHPPDGRCQRYRHGGMLWFKHDDLIGIGYKYLEAGKIIFVNGEFYELEGYWPSEECWMVSLVPTKGVFADASPEDIIRASSD